MQLYTSCEKQNETSRRKGGFVSPLMPSTRYSASEAEQSLFGDEKKK